MLFQLSAVKGGGRAMKEVLPQALEYYEERKWDFPSRV
jgi:hypothetical protein